MKLAIGSYLILFMFTQFGRAQTPDNPSLGRMELLACIEANSSLFNEMLREEQSNHWRDEFAVGIRADCTTSEMVHGTLRAASVDGLHFVVIVHTHPEWPNSGPSTGDYLLTKQDRISRAVLQKRRKIVVAFADGSSKSVELRANESARPSNTETRAPVQAAIPEDYAVFGATPAQEAALRGQIRLMHPEIPPLRVFFVPHWKYLDKARIFRLHVPTGYASLMFTHLPSRTIFIDNDRYTGDDWLGHWIAHELGHLAKNSPKEKDAEKAAPEFRKRLKEAQARLPHRRPLAPQGAELQQATKSPTEN